MEKYEISLWEDYPVEGSKYLHERKIAVIGSDSMRAQNVQARALEPNLVTDINGTNTFTFKMYYKYTDTQTGEVYANPFGKYLINERKVKVLWKDQWYDLVIKKCQEDSSKKSVTYTCTDVFINELSKNGYSLEFDTDLQNNIGTAEELASQVLDGSTWQYDNDSSTPIYQKTEGPVYEVVLAAQLNAIKQNPGKEDSSTIDTYISAGKLILVFYDSLLDILDTTKEVKHVETQFLYSPTGYEQDINDSLVINGNCYKAFIDWRPQSLGDGNYLCGYQGNTLCCAINISNGVSTQYRAERLIKSQRTEYDALLKRYVSLCKDTDGKEVYEVITTEYSNPLAVVNLIANPSNFTNVAGWVGAVDKFQIYPSFEEFTGSAADYSSTSFLWINKGQIYNTGLQSNISYFTPSDVEIQKGAVSGIQKNERYIYRIKAVQVNGKKRTYLQTGNEDNITLNVYKYHQKNDGTIAKDSAGIFTRESVHYDSSTHWLESVMVCNKSIAAGPLEKYGIILDSVGSYEIEAIEFFKEVMGVTSYDENAEVKRMNPGEISLQSYAQEVYKYYYKEDSAAATSIGDLPYLYVGHDRQTEVYAPVYNKYEKVGTIQAKASNRFNILQTIAESFQAWARFRIEHEENGAVKFIDGIPQKFVYFVAEIGEDTGISFEYGIDLKTISRTVDSDKLATKILVLPNSNEFAQHGFCTIARSNQNYMRENFIINLDYFTQQNLLDAEILSKDLYSTQDNYIGYYYALHTNNKKYDSVTDELVVKRTDKTRLEAQKEVQEQYLSAASQQLEQIEADLLNLSRTDTITAALAWVTANPDNANAQARANTYGEVKRQCTDYSNQLANTNNTLDTLEAYITTLETTQKDCLDTIKAKHQAFNDKYSIYLMEGTWQDEDYVDDDKYYLDGVNVAYTSSRPQLSYTINVLRLSCIEEYSSKVFRLGDICYIQDREFFGYKADGITPYKERILVNKISSFFDQPSKDVLTIQNYKTQFDDLFQRITATTQSLQYAQGSYAKAAGVINPDKTLSFATLQDTFDQNEDLVINSSNQDVVWDDTGITLTDKLNTASKTKIMAGGLFITNDGGATWKNAIRGDGISTDLLTAGRINTSEIYVYDGKHPTFRWDSQGITAYSTTNNNTMNSGKFVRFDSYGIYGYNGTADFSPNSIDDIKTNSDFGLVWSGFFLKSNSGSGSFEISTEHDLVITAGNVKRVQIGRINNSSDNYGLELRDNNNNVVFNVDKNGANIAGWIMDNHSIYKDISNSTIGLFSNGRNATIQGKTDNYYFLAGSKFGVTANGEIYASAGKIGGWTINSSSLQCIWTGDSGLKVTTTINGADGSITSETKKNNSLEYSWSLDVNGFQLTDERGKGNTDYTGNKSKVAIGNTTIDNNSITTSNVKASGGTVGGCNINNSSISGNSWSIASTGITVGECTLPTDMSWSSIDYIADISLALLQHKDEEVSVISSVKTDPTTGFVTEVNYAPKKITYISGWGTTSWTRKTASFLTKAGTSSTGQGDTE